MGTAILKHKGIYLPYYTITTSDASAYSIKIADYGVSSSGVYFASPVKNNTQLTASTSASYNYGGRVVHLQTIGVSSISSSGGFGRNLSVSSNSITAYSYAVASNYGGASSGPHYAYTGWKCVLIPDPSFLISVGSVAGTLDVSSYSDKCSSADDFIFKTTLPQQGAVLDGTGWYSDTSYGGSVKYTVTKTLSDTTLTYKGACTSAGIHSGTGSYSDPAVAMYLIPNDIYYFAGSL